MHLTAWRYRREWVEVAIPGEPDRVRAIAYLKNDPAWEAAPSDASPRQLLKARETSLAFLNGVLGALHLAPAAVLAYHGEVSH